MNLPKYATFGQRVGYYSFMTYCGLVFFFLIAPIFVVLPLSFSASSFFEFTPEFMRLEPEAFSLKWYKQMLGICLYHFNENASGSSLIKMVQTNVRYLWSGCNNRLY